MSLPFYVHGPIISAAHHRHPAAYAAIWRRRRADNFFARALPPRRAPARIRFLRSRLFIAATLRGGHALGKHFFLDPVVRSGILPPCTRNIRPQSEKS